MGCGKKPGVQLRRPRVCLYCLSHPGAQPVPDNQRQHTALSRCRRAARRSPASVNRHQWDPAADWQPESPGIVGRRRKGGPCWSGRSVEVGRGRTERLQGRESSSACALPAAAQGTGRAAPATERSAGREGTVTTNLTSWCTSRCQRFRTIVYVVMTRRRDSDHNLVWKRVVRECDAPHT